MPSKRALTLAIEDDTAEKRLLRLAMLDSKLRRRFSKKGTTRKKKDEILAKIAALANLRDEIISSFEHQEEPEETVLDGRDNVGIKHGGDRKSDLHNANLNQKSQEGLAELRLERIYGIKVGSNQHSLRNYFASSKTQEQLAEQQKNRWSGRY